MLHKFVFQLIICCYKFQILTGLGPSITCLTGRSRGYRALLFSGHKLLLRCCRSGVLYYWSFTTIWWCLRAETTYFHQQWPNPHRRRCCTPLYPLTSSASCLPNMKTSSIGTSLNFALALESQALFCRSYNLSLESILLSFWRQFFQLILLQDSALYVHELMGVFTT